MYVLDHENISKTKKSIFIVCILSIAVANYLSFSNTITNVGGLLLSIRKIDVLGSLSLGLIYLWLVILNHVMQGPFLDWLKRKKKIDQDAVRDAFTEPSHIRQQMHEAENYYDDAEIEATIRVENSYVFKYSLVKRFSQAVFWIPVLTLSILVLFKYDGLYNTLTLIKRLLF